MKNVRWGLIFVLNLGKATAQSLPAAPPGSHWFSGVSFQSPLKAAVFQSTPAAAVLDSGFSGYAAHRVVVVGSGLAETSFGWAQGVKSWRMMGSAFSFGMEEMKYSLLKAGLARRLWKGFSMGMAWGWGQWRGRGEGKAAHPFYQLGFCWRRDTRWIFFADVENPWLPAATNGPAVVFRIGMEYCLSDEVAFRGNIIYEENGFPVWVGGLQYRLGETAWFRTSLVSGTGKLQTAFGLNKGAWSMETGTEYHLRLGFSPCLALHFKPAKQ